MEPDGTVFGVLASDDVDRAFAATVNRIDSRVDPVTGQDAPPGQDMTVNIRLVYRRAFYELMQRGLKRGLFHQTVEIS